MGQGRNDQAQLTSCRHIMQRPRSLEKIYNAGKIGKKEKRTISSNDGAPLE